MTDMMDVGATALAKYLREASDASERAGHNAILVTVPKPFTLPLWEAREIAERLEGSFSAREAMESALREADLLGELCDAYDGGRHDFHVIIAQVGLYRRTRELAKETR